MGVAGDDDIDALTRRISAETLDIVHDAQTDPADIGFHDFRKRCRPALTVVVATHRDDRGDLAERLEDRGAADIARVDDHIHTGQRRDSLRPQESVGVGDDADDGSRGRRARSLADLAHGRRV